MSSELWGSDFLPQQQTKQQQPKYQWLYQSLLDAILSGKLTADTRIPASRILAAQLNVSRNTVRHALDLLLAEGYLESKQGSGVFVAKAWKLQTSQPEATTQEKANKPLSELAQRIENTRLLKKPFQSDALPLTPAVPDLRHFPYKLWHQCLERTHRSRSAKPWLQEQITQFLAMTRGVRCEPEQVFIYEGAGRPLHQLLALLLNPKEKVLLESPFWSGMVGIIQTLQLQAIHAVVDQAGVNPDTLEQHPDLSVAMLTPTRNYPLGYTLSLERRLQFLKWAQERGAWIIEDDYDSEFRAKGAPVAALQGLDHSDSVFYIGTFSRAMFQNIRLAYMVVPKNRVHLFERTQRVLHDGVSEVLQYGMARFMAEGYFSQHLRKMQKLYQARGDYFQQKIQRDLGDILQVAPSDGGMHRVCYLPTNTDDQQLAQALNQQGLGVQPLSKYFPIDQAQKGLVMGFAAHDFSELDSTIEKLLWIKGNG